MAEEIKETETTDNTPKEELDETTKELIGEALSEAKDPSKPWYKRSLSYVFAVILIALFYTADQLGPEVVNKIVDLVQQLLQLI